MNKASIIPIFFACDNDFVKYTTVAIKSLIMNASKDRLYHIHILNTGIDEDKQQIVLDMADEIFSISFDDVSSYMSKVKGTLPLRDYYSHTTYYRLFMADIYPQYDKAIYLDSDVIVKGDIAQLYDHELGENLVAAAPDQVIVQTEVFRQYSEKVLGIDHNKYFNAGVMIFNCKAFREEGIYDRFSELLNTYTFVVAQDQDYLNVLSKDRVLILDQKWDSEVYGEFLCTEEEMCIIHYNFGTKPWKNKNGRLADYFWQYAKLTPVYEEIMQVCNTFSKKLLAEEEEVGKRLVQTAWNEIARPDNYFNIIKGRVANEQTGSC